ncbi:RluA family pseudouridine synthase [Chromatiaceae bacterium AAb-1]|nr:RluA family pseudouridine synthase [Chromatiaceae bacterium AAb-1]
MTTSFNYNPPLTPLLDILHQDKDIMVLNKPGGLLTCPGKGEHLADSLLSRVQQQFPLARLVHRLDLATSGIVVIALRKKAEVALKQQFAHRQVQKRYLAVVWGNLQPDSGSITFPLLADADNPPLQKVCYQQGKAAQTHFRVIQRLENISVVELKPITGRSHQLRVHLQTLGHPILGDAFYAHPEALAASPRLLLHAAELSFSHPYHNTRLTFTAATDFTDHSGQLSPEFLLRYR